MTLATPLLCEEGSYEWQYIAGHYFVATGRGVSAVRLHLSIDAKDAFQKKRQHGYAILLRQQHIGCVELLYVVWAVVRGEGNPCQYYLGSTGLKGFEYLVEVGSSVFDAQSAEAIIAAKLYDDDRWLHAYDTVHSL